MRQAPRSPLSFKLQRVANVPEHPPPSTRLMSCAHIANRQLSRIIGASCPDEGKLACPRRLAWTPARTRAIIEGIYHLRHPRNTAAPIQALPSDAHLGSGVNPLCRSRPLFFLPRPALRSI